MIKINSLRIQFKKLIVNKVNVDFDISWHINTWNQIWTLYRFDSLYIIDHFRGAEVFD